MYLYIVTYTLHLSLSKEMTAMYRKQGTAEVQGVNTEPQPQSLNASATLITSENFLQLNPPNVRLYPSQDRAVMLNFNYPWMVLLFHAMMVLNA